MALNEADCAGSERFWRGIVVGELMERVLANLWLTSYGVASVPAADAHSDCKRPVAARIVVLNRDPMPHHPRMRRLVRLVGLLFLSGIACGGRAATTDVGIAGDARAAIDRDDVATSYDAKPATADGDSPDGNDVEVTTE